MKTIRYTADAARDLRRHSQMAPRIRKILAEYAEGAGAHANQVKALKGSSGLRLRIGDFRVIFEETATDITVTKLAPRGGAYD